MSLLPETLAATSTNRFPLFAEYMSRAFEKKLGKEKDDDDAHEEKSVEETINLFISNQPDKQVEEMDFEKFKKGFTEKLITLKETPETEVKLDYYGKEITDSEWVFSALVKKGLTMFKTTLKGVAFEHVIRYVQSQEKVYILTYKL